MAILGIASALYDDGIGWPKLKKAINDASAGNGSKLLALADEYTGRTRTGKYFSNENDVATLISCLDWPNQATFAEMQSTSSRFSSTAPILGPYLVFSQLSCNYLESSKSENSLNINTIKIDPVLIIGVTRDPATPYEWAVALNKKIHGSIFLTLEATGHTGQGRGFLCVDKKVDFYLLNSKIKPIHSQEFC